MEIRHLASIKAGLPFSILGMGLVYLHFCMCMVIGDTKGHDDMSSHYNAHSSNIARMVRDCNIPQECGDDPEFQCQFVHQADIEEIVNHAIQVVEER